MISSNGTFSEMTHLQSQINMIKAILANYKERKMINPKEITLLTQYKAANIEQALRRAIACEGSSSAINLSEEQELQLITQSDINKRDDNPSSLKTALHIAIEKNNIKWVKALLQAKAQIDILDAKKETALCLAAKSSNIEIRNSLFNHAAKLALQEISSYYKIITDKAERTKIKETKEFSTIWDAQGKFILGNYAEYIALCNFIICAYLVKAQGIDQENPTEKLVKHIDASQKLKDYSIFLAYLSACKEGYAKYPNIIATCEASAIHLTSSLMRHKAFNSGNISFNLCRILSSQEKSFGHDFVMIDGSINLVSPSTILCNPLNGEIFNTPASILDYLKINPVSESLTVWKMENPNTADFLRDKDELETLLSDLMLSFLKEPINQLEFIGHYKALLLNTCQKLYSGFSVKQKELLNYFLKDKKIVKNDEELKDLIGKIQPPKDKLIISESKETKKTLTKNKR